MLCYLSGLSALELDHRAIKLVACLIFGIYFRIPLSFRCKANSFTPQRIWPCEAWLNVPPFRTRSTFDASPPSPRKWAPMLMMTTPLMTHRWVAKTESRARSQEYVRFFLDCWRRSPASSSSLLLVQHSLGVTLNITSNLDHLFVYWLMILPRACTTYSSCVIV